MDFMEELRDMEEIKKLRRRYCYLADALKMDEIIDLFTDDCHANLDILGQFPDREALAAFYRAVPSRVTFTAHMMHNPIIEVSGDEATGDWYLTSHIAYPNKDAVLILAISHDEYKRVDGVWKIHSITYDFKYMTPYEKGWGKQPFPAPPQG